MKISTVVRAILSIALLVGVATETGPFTTLAVALTIAYAELLSILVTALQRKP